MKFRRQFDETLVEYPVRPKSISLTQPNMVEPLVKTLRRLQSGNSFGVNRFSVEYDADVMNGDEESIESVNIDRSDPLTSVAEQTQLFYEIHKNYKHVYEERKKKALENPPDATV